MANQKPLPSQQPFTEKLFYLLIVLAFTAGLLTGFLIWGQQNADSAPDNAAPAADIGPTPTQKIIRYDVSPDDDPSIGPENAPITIIEFSDYQCPYCRRWAEQVEKQLLDTYGDKVRLVYRDFPLTSIHDQAFAAAEAANCAGEQGKYWEYHDALFAQRYGLGQEAYLKYAKDLGLNLDQFAQCLKEHRYKDEVQADLNEAMQIGVRSTPTFFINGIAVVGAQPFEVFQSLIDKELAGELPK